MYYKYVAKLYLALAKPFGWVNVMFHNKHVKAIRILQGHEAVFAANK
tara:strand:- start:100 stop:240 length:141 start_codon:yes stop_codon:yes gene_type:complete